MKPIDNNKGFTLIETLLSLTLFCMIIGSFTYFFLFQFRNYNRQLKILNDQQNIHEAVLNIQKNIRVCNQQQIIYHSNKKTFEMKNHKNEICWIDLSGHKRNSFNTLLYFYKDKEQLRSNKQGENNIVVENIKEIFVHKMIKKKIVKIEVFGQYNHETILLRINER